MTKWLAVTLGTVLVLAGAVTVFAATGRGGGDIDRQTFKWTGTDISTTSSDWQSVTGLKARTGCQGDSSTSASVSLELAEGSSPIEVRVAMDDPLTICGDCPGPEGVMRPAAVRFEDSSSFTFVAKQAVG